MRPHVSTWCCTALAVLVTAGAVYADPPGALPADTLRSSGYPPLAPDPEVVRGDAARLAWAERTLALAGATRDVELQSDLYLSAAEVLLREPDQRLRCYAALQQGLATRPASDPFGALGRVSLLELALTTRPAPGIARFCAPAYDYLRQPPPLDPTPEQARRDATARRRIRAEFPPLAVRYALSDDNLEMAGGWALTMARHPDPSWRESDAERWERVAVLSYRMGKLDAARGYGEKARSLATDPETQARLAFWRLYLDHRMLSAEGLITQVAVPPGPTFLADLEAVLRGLAGNDRVGEFLLAAGSSALHTRAYEVALAVYRRALTERDFVARAHRDGALWGGLLPAVDAALMLGRFDEAEDLIASVERIAGEPVPEADAYRTRTALARKAAAEGKPIPVPPPLPPAPPDPPRRPRGTGELDIPAPNVGEEPLFLDREATSDGADAPGGAGGTLWVALALLALLALIPLLRRRR